MRLNHVTLTVSDLARSADFYARLGFEPIVAASGDYARFRSPEGDATLSLHTADGDTPGDPPTASIHLEVDDVDGSVAELQARGFTCDQPPTDMPYLWREAILHDPDGTPVFVYHAGKNRLDPPWRVGREDGS